MKKKFLILFLVLASIVICALCLVGCDTNVDNTGNQNDDTEQTGGIGDDKKNQDSDSENQGGEDDSNSKNQGGEEVSKITVTFDANGGKLADGKTSGTQQVQNGQTLTVPNSPTRSLWTFKGWSIDKSGKDMWLFAIDTVTADITLYAIWEEQSAVIFGFDGANIDENTMKIDMLVDKDTESVSLSNKVTCSSDSAWKLYYDRLGQMEIPTKIASGRAGELENGDNKFYMVVASVNGAQVNVYELTVHRSYAVSVNFYDNKDNLLKTDTAYTGFEYNINYTPVISGYTFDYWQMDGNKITVVMTYEPVKITATCTPKKFKATLNVNGGDEISETENTVTYDAGFIFPKPTRTGYTFKGWYDSDTQLTNEEGISIRNWGYAYDKTFISAGWQANEYTLILNSNISEACTVSGAGKHNYDSNISINAIANKGYSWLGWYNTNDELVSDKLYYTFKMGLDVTYTAKWKENEDLKMFNWSSTSDTLRITGIKDKTLTEIVVPDYVTSLSKGAFSGCTLIEKLTIPFGDNTGVDWGDKTIATTLCKLFGAQNYSESNYVPSSLKSVILTKVDIISEAIFYGCSGLESITLPEGVKSIGMDVFYNCSGLKSITIPKSVTYINFNAFRGCSGLESVIFENSSGWLRKHDGSSHSWSSISVTDLAENAKILRELDYEYKRS